MYAVLVLASNAISQQAWTTHAAECLLMQALRETKVMNFPFTLLDFLCSVLAQWEQSSCGNCWDGSFEGLVERCLI